ncbi:hypothetical protein OG413_43390 [Streptomyces sp. NBC_01433]|uniref:hypothetical protein n=1 Tax=Streptomyces sp. NBC_01433 TaxID=2903864 RepID=UPI00225B150C|nr:hypothetical protein [Streptomyces sp. NBC_01433]MCX4682031.1 hypothetical protein [Streptomyces sp. NBC_01433]
MLAPEVHPAPKSTKHPGRAQAVIGGSTSEAQVLFFTEAEARQWATAGKQAETAGQPGAVQLQKLPADFLADAWSPTPVPAADPGAPAGSSTATPPPAVPAPANDQAVGLCQAAEHHLPGITLAALRFARTKRPGLPRLGRQARRRTPLPRRRPQGVGPQPAPRRHRHHRPGLTRQSAS